MGQSRRPPLRVALRHLLRYDINMPWTADDAERHTHKATTPELKELWAKIANESLERDGDEGRAIREANAAIARQA
jgi:hypothetical protein